MVRTLTRQATPFGTVHITATGPDEASAKRAVSSAARGHGRAITRRSHSVGDTVTVFAIYRKAV